MAPSLVGTEETLPGRVRDALRILAEEGVGIHLLVPKGGRRTVVGRRAPRLLVVVAGQRTAPPPAIAKRLAILFPPEEAARWWRTPQSRFDGRSPEQVTREGGAERIERLLIRLEHGIHA